LKQFGFSSPRLFRKISAALNNNDFVLRRSKLKMQNAVQFRKDGW